jgi:hypothetical protein
MQPARVLCGQSYPTALLQERARSALLKQNRKKTSQQNKREGKEEDRGRVNHLRKQKTECQKKKSSA